jgi:hypothetical protein
MKSLELQLTGVLWYYHNDEMYDSPKDDELYIDILNALKTDCCHDRYFKYCSVCLANECQAQARLIIDNLDILDI